MSKDGNSSNGTVDYGGGKSGPDRRKSPRRRRLDHFWTANDFVTTWLKKQEKELTSQLDELDERTRTLNHFDAAKATYETTQFRLLIFDSDWKAANSLSISSSVQVRVARAKSNISNVSICIHGMHNRKIGSKDIESFSTRVKGDLILQELAKLLEVHNCSGRLSTAEEHEVIRIAFILCGTYYSCCTSDDLGFGELNKSLAEGFNLRKARADQIGSLRLKCIIGFVLLPMLYVPSVYLALNTGYNKFFEGPEPSSSAMVNSARPQEFMGHLLSNIAQNPIPQTKTIMPQTQVQDANYSQEKEKTFTDSGKGGESGKGADAGKGANSANEKERDETNPSKDFYPSLVASITEQMKARLDIVKERESGAAYDLRVAAWLATVIVLSTMVGLIWLVHVSAKYAREEWRAANRLLERRFSADSARVNILVGNFRGFQHNMEQVGLPSEYTYLASSDEE